MYTFSKKQFVVVVALLIFMFAGSFWYSANAITTKNLKSSISSTRYRVTFNDVIAGTDIGVSMGLPQGSFKKVKLLTLPGANQILSAVTNVTVGFRLSNGGGAGIGAIRAENSAGEQVSSGDVWSPTDLGMPQFVNRLGNGNEFAFYDEINPTDIVLYITSNDGVSSLDDLTQGSVDFYIASMP